MKNKILGKYITMPRRRNSLAKRVNKLEKVSRPEVKFATRESGAFDNVGAIQGTLIKPQVLAQGTARNQRIGDKCLSRNIRFQAIFKMPNSPANPTCALRILVVRSKVQDPNTSNTGTGDFPSWYGTVDEDKFFIVKDILTQVSWQGVYQQAGTTGSTLKKVKFNIPVGMRKLQYDGSNAMSPLNNEYCIYLLAENGSAEVAYNFQHYYIDN